MSEHDDTPLMRQYREIKRGYPEAILFFRVGDFYEMFYEDAGAASKLLSIALTSRDKSTCRSCSPVRRTLSRGPRLHCQIAESRTYRRLVRTGGRSQTGERACATRGRTSLHTGDTR